MKRATNLVALLAFLVALARPAAAEPGLEIRVLSYNTHGLAAWAAGDDPEARFPRIGALANRYDVALLQEDFEHHERLLPRVRHGVVSRGNESRFGSWLCPVCAGSGLTLLARWPDALERLVNTAYGICSGWLGAANDCFATKGFQHARLRLPGGLQVDFVNTHLDAGDGEEDRGARAGQLEALQRHLHREAAGRALVVAGDFNLDDGVPEDVALRDAFASSLALSDSGARAAPGSDWTRLDYIYVRDGADTRLEILAAGEDPTFVHEGSPLSDHPAIFTTLRVQPTPTPHDP